MTPIEQQIYALSTAIDWVRNGHPDNRPKAYRIGPNVFCTFCGTRHIYSRFLSDEDRFVDICPKCHPEDV